MIEFNWPLIEYDIGIHGLKIAKHTLNTSHVAENGKTANPTSKSATAKLTIKKFVTLRNLWEQNTAAITRQLPTMTSTLINANTANDIRLPGSVHLTDSNSVQLLIAFRLTNDLCVSVVRAARLPHKLCYCSLVATCLKEENVKTLMNLTMLLPAAIALQMRYSQSSPANGRIHYL